MKSTYWPAPLSVIVVALTLAAFTCWPGAGVNVASTQLPVLITQSVADAPPQSVGALLAVDTVPPLLAHVPMLNVTVMALVAPFVVVAPE